MVLKKLEVGMTVYECRLATGLHVFNGKWRVWHMLIEKIDIENEKVKASTNGRSSWYYKNCWSKWRLKKPKN